MNPKPKEQYSKRVSPSHDHREGVFSYKCLGVTPNGKSRHSLLQSM